MLVLLRLLICLVPFFCQAEARVEENIILSTPEQIATLCTNDEMLIAGVISPFSGLVSLHQTDIKIKAAQNITILRTYLSPSIPSTFPKHNKRQGEWNNFYLSR
ncbi:MAG: hypothetical protein KAR79_05855 [Simkaniaceae bacterium]|nr:hypothetical protein [Simkaniaceae bacterium]